MVHSDFEHLQEMFKKQGIRLTYQRQVILDILRATKLHPTAEMVYATARERIPSISLGTVYRNLSFLRDRGIIQELDFGKGISRYDGDPNPHYHVRCIGCEKVEDVDIPVIGGLDRRAEDQMGYRDVKHRLEFLGLCTDCVGH